MKAFVSVKTGKTYIMSEEWGEDEAELPEDLETNDEYVALPDKKELGLGRDVIFEFVLDKMSHEWETVRDMFRRKGAYGRFKSLLISRNKRDEWHKWEDEHTRAALEAWCAEHGLAIYDGPSP